MKRASCAATKENSSFKCKYWHRSRSEAAFCGLTSTSDNLPTCTAFTSQANLWHIMQKKRGGTTDPCRWKQAQVCFLSHNPSSYTEAFVAIWLLMDENDHIYWGLFRGRCFRQRQQRAHSSNLWTWQRVVSLLWIKWVTASPIKE